MSRTIRKLPLSSRGSLKWYKPAFSILDYNALTDPDADPADWRQVHDYVHRNGSCRRQRIHGVALTKRLAARATRARQKRDLRVDLHQLHEDRPRWSASPGGRRSRRRRRRRPPHAPAVIVARPSRQPRRPSKAQRRRIRDAFLRRRSMMSGNMFMLRRPDGEHVTGLRRDPEYDAGFEIAYSDGSISLFSCWGPIASFHDAATGRILGVGRPVKDDDLMEGFSIEAAGLIERVHPQERLATLLGL